MKILVACEESQEVCKAFRERGHVAYSCDIQECSGGHPEWHIQEDVTLLLNGNCEFTFQNGQTGRQTGRWDLIIAHPPCTDLCVSGARHFSEKRANGKQEESIRFFKQFLDADCDKIAIENPVGIIGGAYISKWFPQFSEMPKCTQIIQPYEFGDPHRKSTCLWIKGLPKLIPTNIVEPTLITYVCKNGKKVTFDEYMVKGFNGNRSKHRSKTFPGIAKAMAEQWGNQ